jgi:hypothetical protein
MFYRLRLRSGYTIQPVTNPTFSEAPYPACRVGTRSPDCRQNSATRSRNSAPAAARLGSLCIICLPVVFVPYYDQFSPPRNPVRANSPA